MNRTTSALDFVARLPGMPSDDGVIEQVRDVLHGSGFQSLRLSVDAARPNEGPFLIVGWNRDDLRRHLAEAGAAAPGDAPLAPGAVSAPPEPSARLQRRPRAGKSPAAPAPAAPWTIVSATPSIATADDGAPTADEIAMLRLLADLVQDMLNRAAPVVETAPATERPLLSPREHECLKWTAAGKTTWEIAAILAISQNTTDGYIASATRKLGAVNRTQAVAEALRRGIIT